MYNIRFLKITFFTAIFLFLVQYTNSQNKLDSLQQLGEIVITAQTHKEVIPAQKLTGTELEALSSFSVADALRYFSGIQVKDYGGIGGIKTVNIRSMGTHHVGVFYDGVQLGNAQNGQVDLGKFSLDNMEEISLYNGQKSEIFQPAKDFGSSGSIYMRSRIPKFARGKAYNLKATVKAGSFDLINPSILYEHKLSRNVSLSLSAEVVNASGKYKFRHKRVFPGTHTIANDTTATRKNGDVYSSRVESGVYGVIPDGHWRVKTYFYDSNRGLPGAMVGNSWENNQRQWDRNFFIQGMFQKEITSRYEIQANAKFAYDHMHFLNPDTTTMLVDNKFHQREFYLSVANKYAITRYWDVSLSVDYQRNTLGSDMKGFVHPERNTYLIAAATALELGKVKMQGSVLTTIVDENFKLGNYNPDDTRQDTVIVAPNRKKLSPALFFSYKPFKNKDLNIRAFYKSIFRLPTFNDLYYTNIGNSALKPESTHQFNLGVQYGLAFRKGMFKYWQIQADAYYNEVTNKIVAQPAASSLYRWTMKNLGYVEIKGIDVSSSATIQLPHELLLNVKLAYTYQKAQDFTKYESQRLQDLSYGGQIDYIPWHSGSAIANLMYKSWQLNYSFIYVGERYQTSENSRDNFEPPWYTHDLSLMKQFKINKINMKASGEVNNVFNQYFEVVRNYPMPGRNYKISLTVEL